MTQAMISEMLSGIFERHFGFFTQVTYYLFYYGWGAQGFLSVGFFLSPLPFYGVFDLALFGFVNCWLDLTFEPLVMLLCDILGRKLNYTRLLVKILFVSVFNSP